MNSVLICFRLNVRIANTCFGVLFRARVGLSPDQKTLSFKDVELDDAGVYQCVAENKHGMIVSSTWIHVLGEYSVLKALLLIPDVP